MNFRVIVEDSRSKGSTHKIAGYVLITVVILGTC